MRTLAFAMIGLAAICSVSCQHVGSRTTMTKHMSWSFETDPVAAGWQTNGPYLSDSTRFVGQWAETGGVSKSRCLRVRHGMWQTPVIPVQPLAYYRVRFAARNEKMSFYVFRFFDAQGRELACDEHNAIDPSPEWARCEVFTQARADAATMRLAFLPPQGGMTPAGGLWIDDVSVSRASAAALLAWSDRLYRTLPALAWTPPAARWQHLARTHERLQRGGELRVVLLGDSIANDMGNTQFQLMIQRHYPRSKVVLLRSFRGGTGCPYYQAHVQEYVADKAPDLVIIAGISHNLDADAIRSVVEQTRRLTGQPVEFLAMTGAVIEPGMNWRYKNRGIDSPPPEVSREAFEQERAFHATLEKLGAELGIATLDLRSIWEDYLSYGGQPRTWYQRDFVHANSRGKQILGRVMERFFAPPVRSP